MAAKPRPDDAEIYHYQGRLEYIENRFVEAVAAFQRAIALAPAYTTAHTNLALSYEGTGDLERAAEHHRRAIEIARGESPVDEWPFLNYAAMLMRGTEPKSALPVLEDALRAAPRSARVRLYLGRLYRRLEKWDEALAQFEFACEIDPGDADAHYALATALLCRGDRVRGQQIMERFATLRKKPGGTRP